MTETLPIINENHLMPINKNKGICIYNPNTMHSLYVKNLQEIPNGYIIKPKYMEESRQKMSESAKKRGAPEAAYRDKHGDKNPMYGKHQSIESRKKQSESRKEKLKNNPYYGCNGKKAYYDKDTLRIKYFKPDEKIPDNYIKGRPPKK